MSKHLSQDTWLYLINLYETNKDKFVEEFIAITHRNWESRHVRCAFKRMLKKYYLSKDINVFVSQTGKAPKKGKGSGRPKKDENLDKLTETFINEFPKDELYKIVKDYIKNKKDKDQLIKKIAQNSSLSLAELEYLLDVPQNYITSLVSLD